ncbi:ATP-binding cassette domain-containing protein [Oceanidesulfovibrio marinus]|uniref:ATP-binding cassette domain-containing protein n=1 Tax=Oceanidesulfovibrio marinus TaxID=370038 RepID=A0ABX6NIN9_9BACT|nr:ATP-binding cassette domain-containing protein [Oceanidesulfovibrio marinus]QJT09560.1 ATP-binding cassette domain-containing protein [Oceanidesulfovibrio marinus]
MSSDILTLQSVTVTSGHDKSGRAETMDVVFSPGEITALLGPTGSGKSRFLYDIESLADRDTPSNRCVLLDDAKPDPERRFELQGRLVAQLSQNMNFVLDMGVRDFIRTHAESREADDPEATADTVIQAANDLAGEPFHPDVQLTQLSGGQSRSLMIADAALLSWSPILLIDEIENAGVDKSRALDLLVKSDKIVVIATHDPVLALSANRRLVFENGAVRDVLMRSEAEEQLLARLEQMEEEYAGIRSRLRKGEPLE